MANTTYCVTKCASMDRQAQRAAGSIFLLAVPFAAEELQAFTSKRIGLDLPNLCHPTPRRVLPITTPGHREQSSRTALLGVMVRHVEVY